jgi:hypothetical protein
MPFPSCRLVVLTAVALVSCSAYAPRGPLVESGGFRVSQQFLEEDLSQIRPRAEFAFGCEAAKIDFVVLAVDRENYAARGEIRQIGASGCGHRGIFAAGRRDEWILSSTAADSPPPPTSRAQ